MTPILALLALASPATAADPEPGFEAPSAAWRASAHLAAAPAGDLDQATFALRAGRTGGRRLGVELRATLSPNALGEPDLARALPAVLDDPNAAYAYDLARFAASADLRWLPLQGAISVAGFEAPLDLAVRAGPGLVRAVPLIAKYHPDDMTSWYSSWKVDALPAAWRVGPHLGLDVIVPLGGVTSVVLAADTTAYRDPHPDGRRVKTLTELSVGVALQRPTRRGQDAADR